MHPRFTLSIQVNSSHTARETRTHSGIYDSIQVEVALTHRTEALASKHTAVTCIITRGR